ncbi:MAG TPA: TRC40/GET3/ArsA family transport-energizing ATPase, partial [Pyrinomonadaceae bacterium]|nr:TRC40/GET3/ArsA family transport-energizing ATPase [Pyrinomonadaceae bacterium]
MNARYLFFGGKGGVGKTTAASATALYLLNKLKKDESILLFSTDPAHSLSDRLDVKMGNRLVEVKQHRGARLFAYEMDASLALERFRAEHGKVLAEIAERGTLLDEDDINELLSLSLPGMDEVMSLFELSELDREGAYAHVVVDTAPSGHTSRLLRLPEVFDRMVKALDLMGDKHRYIIAHFARRRPVADEVDLFLQDLSRRIEAVRKLLHDTEQTSFTLVTIPEAMAVRETERYLTLLSEQGVPVRDLIVNRVEQEHGACAYCRARVRSQRPWMKAIARSFKDLEIHYVPLMAKEVRGVDELKKIGKLIWEKRGQAPLPDLFLTKALNFSETDFIMSSLQTPTASLSDFAIVVDPKDNVAVVKKATWPGLELVLPNESVIEIRGEISPGHRFATTGIPAGDFVLQFGQPIGTSLGITQGEQITHDNMTDDVPIVRELPEDLHTAPPDYLSIDARGTFLGYRRPNGRVGTRNYVL